MIYDFDACGLTLPHDSRVVVEAERGEAIGWTVGLPEARDPVVPDAPLRRILRVANQSDATLESDHRVREREALRFCAERARQLDLPMKLVTVEWSHSSDKAAFYFSSEERVDFRALVRELAQRFRIRVEMRQIGPRDEAKIIGAMGPCGRETCCSSWLRAFTPVSVKMARDQGLALNPAKVTGVCGRLLCCLAYEQDTYSAMRRKLPRFGKMVQTARGVAKIIDVLVLREKVRVVFEDGTTDYLAAADVRPLGSPAPIEEPENDGDGDSDVLPIEVPYKPASSRPKPASPVIARSDTPRPAERPASAPLTPPPATRQDSPRRPERQPRPPRPQATPPVVAKPSDSPRQRAESSPRPQQQNRPAPAQPSQREVRESRPPRPERPPRPQAPARPPRAPPREEPKAVQKPADPGASTPVVDSTAPGAATPERHRRRRHRGPRGSGSGSSGGDGSETE
jgi:cell fate regulator YaaT (PSP1 superfamily)